MCRRPPISLTFHRRCVAFFFVLVDSFLIAASCSPGTGAVGVAKAAPSAPSAPSSSRRSCSFHLSLIVLSFRHAELGPTQELHDPHKGPRADFDQDAAVEPERSRSCTNLIPSALSLSLFFPSLS
jgi:hypothetical protein